MRSLTLYEEADDFIASLADVDAAASAQRDAAGSSLVKTHELPEDDLPCIYVIRDGRIAIASYRHFIRHYDRRDTTWEDLIVGRVWPGSWSSHYKAWDPLNRKRTLLIRYEDMRDDGPTVIRRLSEFLEVAPLRPFDVSFAALKQKLPTFFRSANDAAALAEIDGVHDLFMHQHGDVMGELGYASKLTGELAGHDDLVAPTIGSARLAREKDTLAGALVDREADLAAARLELVGERQKVVQLARDKAALVGDLARDRLELVALRERIAKLSTSD